MCGIAGIIGNGVKINSAELIKMNDQIIHRGPDGSGIWHSEDFSIGFAHRRLAIIDLSTNANQPMQYENFISVVTNIGVGNISKKTVPAERSTDSMASVPVSKISLAEEVFS